MKKMSENGISPYYILLVNVLMIDSEVPDVIMMINLCIIKNDLK